MGCGDKDGDDSEESGLDVGGAREGGAGGRWERGVE